MNKLCYVYTVEYYLVVRMNYIYIHLNVEAEECLHVGILFLERLTVIASRSIHM